MIHPSTIKFGPTAFHLILKKAHFNADNSDTMQIISCYKMLGIDACMIVYNLL